MEWLVATFTNVKDTNRNTASSKSVSSILDDSDCEDNVPGNVDDRMLPELQMLIGQAKLNRYRLICWLFWKNKESTYPNVVMQSQKLLCLPVTHSCSLNSLQTCWTSLSLSVPWERTFCVAGETVSKRRSALHPDDVKMLLCLRSWLQ